MADSRDDPEIYWVEPKMRAIIPLDGFRCSRSLAKALRQPHFQVTFNRSFAQVVDACAAPRPGHPDSWINPGIRDSYQALHQAGHAHSLECWKDGELLGGLYGVAFGKVFCGESMFSRANNASKVALSWLVVILRQAGGKLLDCQFMTDHLASLGAREISQQDYLRHLAQAAGSAHAPASNMDLQNAYSEVLAAGASSPGKFIAQSLTHTS